MRGWAWDVRGAIGARVAGRVEVVGKRVGDMKGGQFRRAISAKESTTWVVVGQGRERG